MKVGYIFNFKNSVLGKKRKTNQQIRQIKTYNDGVKMKTHSPLFANSPFTSDNRARNPNFYDGDNFEKFRFLLRLKISLYQEDARFRN